jgi:hypothetical protein
VTLIVSLAALLWYAKGLRALATDLEGRSDAGVSRAVATWRPDSLDGLELRGINEDGADPVRINARVSDYRGRRALRIVNEEGPSAGPRGAEILAIVRSSKFLDGTIDVNIAGFPRKGAKPGTRGFVGLAFRVQDGGRQYETIYLRMTNGRAEDQLRRNHSVQYSALPDYPWNRLRKESPGMYESYVDLSAGAWTRMRVKVAGPTARIYVNGAREPCLIVNDLKLAPAQGKLALWVGSDTVAYFSELSVSEAVDMPKVTANVDHAAVSSNWAAQR